MPIESHPRKIPFLTDEQALSSPWNLTLFVLAAFWVPLYRELHFYFAHRFIHIKELLTFDVCILCP